MSLSPEQLAERARRIRFLLFDVDGVLTDGLLTYGPDGEVTKVFHVRDGHGLVLVRLAGLQAGILTARTSEIVRTRMRELGVRHVVQGARDKLAALGPLLAEAGVGEDEFAYMGDDVNDLPVLRRAALSACPADAAPEVRRSVHLVAQSPGGRGAVRELCELILKAHGKWEE